MANVVLAPSVAAFAGGVAIWMGYFHRYECHMWAFSYFFAFVAGYIGGAITLVKFYGWNLLSAAVTSSAAAFSFLLGAFGSTVVWRLFFSPLNKFPGPYAARISNLWLSTKLGNSDGFYLLQDFHKKYGKFVRIGSNDLSIIDPDAMEFAYGNRSRVTKSEWYDNDYPLTSMHTSRDKGLHDRRRRVWAPAFSDKALRDYETEIQVFNDKVVEKFGEHSGAPVNVSKWFNLFSFDAMGLLAFGKNYGMLDQGEKPHELEMLDEGMQPLAYRFPSWFFRMLTQIPGLGAGYQKFVKFCVDELTWRVQNANATSRDSDMMGWLLKAYENHDHPEQDTLLQADARLIIVAGSDTTAATFTYLFYHLAQDPAQVKKLREELEKVGRGEWADKDIRNCEHLNGCINEALRLHPPVPSGVNRLTPPEGMTVGDTWVPGNTMFIMPQYVMGRGKVSAPVLSEF